MDKTILVVGVYLADQKNNIREITKEFNGSSNFKVIQKWAKLGENKIPDNLKMLTTLDVQKKTPKFIILNKLLSGYDLNQFDYILISDDDIALPKNFVDSYMEIVKKYDFALAQPARTHDSYIDHFIVEQLDGLVARKTRFVEVGPVFSVRKDLFDHILPFDEANGMGWGYDQVWPCIIEKLGMNMGIVDASPVEHNMRAQVSHYSFEKASNDQNEYLIRREHLKRPEAFRIIESYT